MSTDVETFIDELRTIAATTPAPVASGELAMMLDGDWTPAALSPAPLPATARTRRRWPRVAIAAPAFAAVLFGGFAAAGALPSPLQHATARFVAHLGVTIPDHHADAHRPAHRPAAHHAAPTAPARGHTATTAPRHGHGRAATDRSRTSVTGTSHVTTPTSVAPNPSHILPPVPPVTVPGLPPVTVPPVTVPTLPALPSVP